MDEEEDNSKKGEARSHKIFSSDKFNIFNVTDNPRVSGETEAVTDNANNELLKEEDEVDLKEEESVIKKETIFEEQSSQEEESYELEDPDKEEEVDWHKILQSNKNNHTPKEQEEQETVRKEENTLKMPNLKSYDVSNSISSPQRISNQYFRVLRSRRCPRCTLPARPWKLWINFQSKAT